MCYLSEEQLHKISNSCREVPINNQKSLNILFILNSENSVVSATATTVDTFVLIFLIAIIVKKKVTSTMSGNYTVQNLYSDDSIAHSYQILNLKINIIEKVEVKYVIYHLIG
jgi:nitrate reductase gamma subunit